ncbi:hypothetical protein ACVWXO_000773 [Bradyrhizobium sp. LM2.7]
MTSPSSARRHRKIRRARLRIQRPPESALESLLSSRQTHNFLNSERLNELESMAHGAAVVRRMTVDLEFPIDIITAGTVWKTDGLALSSRNRYSSQEKRQRAIGISRAIFAAPEQFHAREREVDGFSRKVAFAIRRSTREGGSDRLPET